MVSQNICHHTTFRTTEHKTSVVAHSEQIYSAKTPKSCQRIHRLTMTSTQLFLACVVILISATTASIQEEGIACTAMAIAIPGLLTLQGEKTRFATSAKELSKYHLPTQYSHTLTFCYCRITMLHRSD
jgi:hypothetical protein